MSLSKIGHQKNSVGYLARVFSIINFVVQPILNVDSHSNFNPNFNVTKRSVQISSVSTANKNFTVQQKLSWTRSSTLAISLIHFGNTET